MGGRVEHADALELIGYGLAKFAGPNKGTNEIANHMAGSRSAFFKRLVDAGIAKSKNVVSNRQDNYDHFFGTKKGYITEEKLRVYAPRKDRLDSVVGNLTMSEYSDFIESIIATEIGSSVDDKTLDLINKAKAALAMVPLAEPKEPDEPRDPPEPKEPDDSKRLHIEVQWVLKQLGIMAGCQVFIAKNDGSQQYNGEPLRQGCLDELPKKGMSGSLYRRVSLIDVVWVKNSKIVCAFEVECSTSIYSGILRMSDLAYSVPYDSIKGYIIAPDERKDKVIKELERPTFSNERIQGFMRYMTVEELYELYYPLEKMGFTKGAINPNILEQKAHIVEAEDG